MVTIRVTKLRMRQKRSGAKYSGAAVSQLGFGSAIARDITGSVLCNGQFKK